MTRSAMQYGMMRRDSNAEAGQGAKSTRRRRLYVKPLKSSDAPASPAEDEPQEAAPAQDGARRLGDTTMANAALPANSVPKGPPAPLGSLAQPGPYPKRCNDYAGYAMITRPRPPPPPLLTYDYDDHAGQCNDHASSRSSPPPPLPPATSRAIDMQ